MRVLESLLPAGVALAAAVLIYPGDLSRPAAADTSEALRVLEVAVAGSQPQQRQRQGETMLREQFNIGAGGSLVVDVPDGDVDVETTSGSGVEVEVILYSRDMEWARDIFDRMEFEVAAQGNTVRITARRTRIRRGEWRRNRSFSLVARVRVPRQFNVDINTEDGDIFVADVNGTVALSSSDGDIDLGSIRGPDLTIETSDGDITADALLGTRTEIRTSDGDIDIRSASGRVRASTSDGDIRLRLDEVGDEVRLRTSDGDIFIYAPMTIQAEIDFDAEDLNVARGFDILGRISRRRVRGSLNGGGPLLAATTNDGSITLRGSGR